MESRIPKISEIITLSKYNFIYPIQIAWDINW